MNRCYPSGVAAQRGAVILAAGASQRMGAPKALLPWGRGTLLDSAIEEARAAGVQELVVVLGPATQHLQLDTRSVINPEPETGRSASIRLGAAALPDNLETVLIQSVDQPVSAEVIRALFDALLGTHTVAVPTFAGRRGHPVCLSGRLLAELRAVTEQDQGLRAVVRRHTASLVEVPVNSESVIWNLNDPATYASARAAVQP
jgi:molybdenum cofactor cytidylyltransferase